MFFRINFLAIYPHPAWPVLGIGDIDHRQLNGFTNLLRGQSDTVRFVHGLDHVLRQGPDLVCDLIDMLPFLSQNRITVDDDFANHFVVSLG